MEASPVPYCSSADRLRVGISAFWRNYDRKSVLRAAQAADAMGYDSFWVPETWGYEAFGLLAEMARCTKRIKLGTSIVNIFSRSPALLAMSTATIDDISEGRFILGLGTSARRVVEGFHGIEYEEPLARMREVVLVIRRLLHGERLSKTSTNDLYEPFSLAMTPRRHQVPIFLASLLPKAIEMVGEIADGWMPLFWPYQRISEARERIRRGAARAGRTLEAVAIAPFQPVLPYPDGYALKAGILLLASYIGGMGDYYHAALRETGFHAAVDEVRRLWIRGRRREAAAAVPKQLVDALVIYGNPEHCRRQLHERRAYGVDLAILHLPIGASIEESDEYLRIMAP